MKYIFIILCMMGTSCCNSKKVLTKSANAEEDNTVIQNPLLESIPVCINDLIKGFTEEPKQNPPRKLYSYSYQNKTVYYVTAPCCDFFTDLYDEDCKLMGHPDGGITGIGDGKFPDFIKTRSKENLLWEDKRQ